MLLPRSYSDAVTRAGGLAILLVPDAVVAGDPDELLERLDGLVLSGGADVDPGNYGAAAHPQTGPTDPERDHFELALARRAVERDLPLLGICRGMQVLDVALGGSLHQHLPDVVGHDGHLHTHGRFGDHDVRLAPGSLAARAAGQERHATKSHHHQGIDRLGGGLRVTGWSTLDELPEAVELPDARFVLGVQWHPEADVASGLVGALVQGARRPRAAIHG